MAKKGQTVFVCQECGYESPKWMGRCICGAWDSMIEEKVQTTKETDYRHRGGSEKDKKGINPKPLISVGSADHKRIDTGIRELNRVLGGGLVKGSLTLISGEPGIGKSTIIIQAASNISSTLGTVLYVSGEESEEQIKIRADRVCGKISDNLLVLSETNMENIILACENSKPDFLIIDSIQTMYTEELDSAPGSVSQVRACGNLLMKIGKTGNIPIFIVAHVTKSGELAGPKTVEHMVDCVLNFTGERDHEIRILRALKNRFGTTSEIGAFQMGEQGLMEVQDLSVSFLQNSKGNAQGSVITGVYEGSRPVFLEVQALTAKANIGFARRTAVGIDGKRLAMIIAVLEKKLGVSLINQDVFLNVVGGLRPDSTSMDLSVALAIYSSLREKQSNLPTVVIGEVGLTGELRAIKAADKIYKEAAKLGYRQIIMPKYNEKNLREIDGSCRIIGVDNIREAIKHFCG